MYLEGGAECTGPLLAFVPIRGTKDCAQDDSLEAEGMMSVFGWNWNYFWAALVEGIWIGGGAGATYTTSPGRV
jgi:hypothetical protein